MRSALYNDINKQIETLQKKIEKYNKIIDENNKKNKHLSEYDLLILNGKYTRKVLKEEKNLNELKEMKKNDNKNNYFSKISDTIILCLCSKNKLIRHIKNQIYVVFIFLILNYFTNNNLRESCLKIHSHLKFQNNFKITPSDPCRNNLLHFLGGYNITNLFFFTMKQNFINLFSLIKRKHIQ
ncbi:conserved Plasmodium protein, unknown function [Plasmodium relictum]|uniref:Uncharacterized protein n=1 Tax=Plasmodium relictum TaxID=85471 RepID=A0A1J1H6R7_PLARL|nr:conserved Plasmodium protein, unknown function [Plasmodium relictum]CRH00609.1 conserved Plasmodium protein, unknown function [Plasmodium relictum]